MAINLEKGQRINLEKSNGSKLTNFCVGCNWGAIEETRYEEVVISEGFLGIGRKTEMRPVKYASWGTDGMRWGELAEGRIVLVDHTDARASFRNLKIREL